MSSEQNTNTQMPELTRRQADILSLIIRVYSENAEPVSSKLLVERHGLNISSATVRNEMARLEEMGFITAPHTSAGRIPTAMGYRYFVRGLLNQPHVPPPAEASLGIRLSQPPSNLEQWLRQAAGVLARSSAAASLVTTLSPEQNRFKHLELIAIQGRLVLLVLVLQGGVVQQRMINLSEPLPQELLSQTADRLNALCANSSAPQLRLKLRTLNELEREIGEFVADLMERASSTHTVYQDGLSELVRAFNDSEGAEQAIRIYEEPTFLDFVVQELQDPSQEAHVQVIIAGDGRFTELDQVSIVISRYGVKGQMSGTLGVFGPTRINYDRAIGVVRYVAGVMTETLADLYNPDSSEQKEESD